MEDGFGRQINYLRLSIIDRCNLRCFYCAPVQEMLKVPAGEILRYEELLQVAAIGVALGLTKIRVTGGEPLIRAGVEDFLTALAATPGLAEVTLTTNGVLLPRKASALWAAGLRRLNISLDSLQPRRFAQITGSDSWHQVWEGIDIALSLGFAPLKLNCVVLRGVNDDEVVDFARLTWTLPLEVRFIEFMPIGRGSTWQAARFVPVAEIKERLAPLGPWEPLPATAHDGPAERYRHPGARGTIGFISPLSQHFCHSCNRLRLTATGQLRPCLLNDLEIDLKGPLRAGADPETIQNLFRQAIRNKPGHHHLGQVHDPGCRRRMISIGG